jgi:hypothetical protein
MHSGRRWRAAILVPAVLAIGLLAPGVARDPLRSAAVAEAASLPLLLRSVQTRKGFVTARADRSMTVLEGGRTIQVVVTEKTGITGQRTSFSDVAVNDVVRVEGSMTAEGHLVAQRVEVILAARSVTAARGARTRNANSLISILLNGGVTISRP